MIPNNFYELPHSQENVHEQALCELMIHRDRYMSLECEHLCDKCLVHLKPLKFNYPQH